MRIAEIQTEPNWVLSIIAEDGRRGRFDVKPYLEFEAFSPLQDKSEFTQISNGGYFVEWNCGAELSGDTIEAQWHIVGSTP